MHSFKSQTLRKCLIMEGNEVAKKVCTKLALLEKKTKNDLLFYFLNLQPFSLN